MEMPSPCEGCREIVEFDDMKVTPSGKFLCRKCYRKSRLVSAEGDEYDMMPSHPDSYGD